MAAGLNAPPPTNPLPAKAEPKSIACRIHLEPWKRRYLQLASVQPLWSQGHACAKRANTNHRGKAAIILCRRGGECPAGHEARRPDIRLCALAGTTQATCADEDIEPRCGRWSGGSSYRVNNSFASCGRIRLAIGIGNRFVSRQCRLFACLAQIYGKATRTRNLATLPPSRGGKCRYRLSTMALSYRLSRQTIAGAALSCHRGEQYHLGTGDNSRRRQQCENAGIFAISFTTW